MKNEKGIYGYLDRQIKFELLKIAVCTLLVLAVLLTGYFTTGSRLNLLTVAAILGCLPVCKMMVGFLVRIPYRSLKEDYYKQLRELASDLPAAYELVLTVNEKLMSVDACVFYGNTILGLTRSEKTDDAGISKHLKTVLKGHGYTPLTVKIFHDKKKFAGRIAELTASGSAPDKHKAGEGMREIVLHLSL